MILRTKELNEIRAVFLEGRLDIHRSLEVEAELDRMVADGVTRMVIDLNGLEFLSSSGLRVFLGLMKKLRQQEGRLAFCRMPAEVRKVIRISELDDLFDIHDELDDAVISVRG
ncbi:MAG: Anti-sigma-B factor antagonist [Syntrophaceae bacterium PtaB.Bin095]|jgi:anti-anti-sigma factor|nr:MAG: Anti-sigma-B factor antagonist [Syntrophaceae bacterium PtaB.Bin095]